MKKNSSFSTQFNFFEQQSHKKRTSFLLICVFVLYIVLTCLFLSFLVSYFFVKFLPLVMKTPQFVYYIYGSNLNIYALKPFLIILFVFSLTAFLTVFNNYSRLKKNGGVYVAKALKATIIYKYNGVAKKHRKKILNIASEMSLASGFPMPVVYILPSSGINAMVSGFSYDDMVLIVTEGALLHLNRDELAGVIGHEFGHLANGDMQYKLMATAWINGFLLLSIIGYTFLEPLFSSDYEDPGVNFVKNSRVFLFYLVIAFFAFIIHVIGLVGEFFVGLIQNVFNRQREFLADASSAQFTRNHLALASAFKKIGGSYLKGQIFMPKALAVQHLFIVKVSSVWNVFSSHPPLKKRILALDPNWDGEYIKIEKEIDDFSQIYSTVDGKTAYKNLSTPAAIFALSFLQNTDKEQFPFTTFDYFKKIKKTLPPEITKFLYNNDHLIAIICALIIFDDEVDSNSIQFEQLAIINKFFYEPISQRTLNHLKTFAKTNIARDSLLNILDILAPAIRLLPYKKKGELHLVCLHFIEGSKNINLYKLAIFHMLNRLLDLEAMKYLEPLSLKEEKKLIEEAVLYILNLLAQAGNKEDESLAKDSFLLAIDNLTNIYNLDINSKSFIFNVKIEFHAFNNTLNALQRTGWGFKKDLMNCIVTMAFYDGKIQAQENELLRALAASLGLSLMGLKE